MSRTTFEPVIGEPGRPPLLRRCPESSVRPSYGRGQTDLRPPLAVRRPRWSRRHVRWPASSFGPGSRRRRRAYRIRAGSSDRGAVAAAHSSTIHNLTAQDRLGRPIRPRYSRIRRRPFHRDCRYCADRLSPDALSSDRMRLRSSARKAFHSVTKASASAPSMVGIGVIAPCHAIQQFAGFVHALGIEGPHHCPPPD